jgi:ABC-type phosphate/phosphonate transport system substrate-binding protein
MEYVSGLCFALPPSLGSENVRALAREFASVLYEAGFETVVPVRSYELLERALLSGEVHAAWGPPMVCAQIEEAGGKVALRAVRSGSVSYRSALVCRSHDDLALDEIGQLGLRKLRAVWVDKYSMGGYVLPRHHLRTLGVDLDQAFESEKLLGSYEACFDAVMECDADITASFANARGLGYVQLCTANAHQLRTISYTTECSNDGVIVSPAAVASSLDVFARLSELMKSPAKHAIICGAFDVDDLAPPPPGSYRGLLSLLG